MPRPASLLIGSLLAISAAGPTQAQAPNGQGPNLSLTFREHRFEPAELGVPAGQKLELQVTNASNTPAEFESADLRREKVVPAGKSVTISIGPLRAGRYEFFDDFHPSTRGYLVAH